MSEENKNSQDNSDSGNIKAEMNRKLGNLEETTNARFDELRKLNEQLVTQVQTLATNNQTAKKQSVENQTADKEIDDLWYDNPGKAAEVIENRAEQKALQKFREEQRAVNEQQAIIAQMVSEYPDVSDKNSKLHKRAIEIYNKMSDSDKASPLSTKVAILDAAAELGVSSKSSNPGNTDDFTLSSSGSATKPAIREGQVNDNTLEFARIMGLDVNDEKTRDNLKKHSERFADPTKALKFK